jgi:hypothetical protein
MAACLSPEAVLTAAAWNIACVWFSGGLTLKTMPMAQAPVAPLVSQRGWVSVTWRSAVGAGIWLLGFGLEPELKPGGRLV